MSTKGQRIAAAERTLFIFQDGWYATRYRTVNVAELHGRSLASTTLYTPQDFTACDLPLPLEGERPAYAVSPQPVVKALQELHNAGRKQIGVLNFASAKNPGGGFLNGAEAQEESLAMCSNLYLTQIENPQYYEANRECGTMLYTDHMIFSRDVVFIREDTNSLWDDPITASVLTAPAVNMGEYLRRERGGRAVAESVMKARMRKVLTVFAKEGCRVLLLGAYGCGVFRNDPAVIAQFFRELLMEEHWEHYFTEIVFAVYDSSKDGSIYKAFEKEFAPWTL